MKILEHLTSTKNLNKTEEKICQYIIDHVDEIPKISSRQLARLTYSNPTTILRLTKKLGFENYNDFKVNIVLYLKNMPLTQDKVSKSDDMITVQNYMATLHNDVIDQMRTKLNTHTLNAIYTLMSET